MYDCIIIGAGLAGVTLGHFLEKNKKTFCVISDHSQPTSRIAGGVYNPVVLKRFTPIWRADEVSSVADSFYTEAEKAAGLSFRKALPVWRKFASVEEQNNWFAAADNLVLQHYLGGCILSSGNTAIPAPFGLGEVLHTGRLDIKLYLDNALAQWQKQGIYYEQTFDYELLQICEEYVVYKGVEARNIVFCEGCGVANNPYFKNVPMRPCKGETLTFSAPDLKLNNILKSDGVIIPLGNELYTVGATYDPEDLTECITEVSRTALIEKLEKMICCDYEIVSHQAGIRPTVADRRPLVGQHPIHIPLWILNGLGTRGVLNAPLCAQVLYNAIFQKIDIPQEMNVNRFTKRLKKYL